MLVGSGRIQSEFLPLCALNLHAGARSFGDSFSSEQTFIKLAPFDSNVL